MRNIEPILLNLDGDRLVTRFDSTDCIIDVTDESCLSKVSYIGMHEMRGGFIEPHKSNNYIAYRCRSCGLKIKVPKDTDTYGRLRWQCKKAIEAEATRERVVSALIESFLKQETKEAAAILMAHLKPE